MANGGTSGQKRYGERGPITLHKTILFINIAQERAKPRQPYLNTSSTTLTFSVRGATEVTNLNGCTTIPFSIILSNNASDDFTIKSSLHKIGCLSRAHKASPCWATTSNSITTREILDTKNKKLGENSHSSVPNLL